MKNRLDAHPDSLYPDNGPRAPAVSIGEGSRQTERSGQKLCAKSEIFYIGGCEGVIKPDVVMMAGNSVKLNDGSEIQITLEQENGFIKDLNIEGSQFLESEGLKQDFIEALRWVHLNQVALYTRIRFFLLKNRSGLRGIDEEGLASAICNSA